MIRWQIRADNPGKTVEIWFQDEARFGQQGTLTRQWAIKGTSPTAWRQTQYDYLYVLGAVCPQTGQSVGLLAPYLNTDSVNAFFREFEKETDPDIHVVMIWDQAGFHTSKSVKAPANVTIIPLLTKRITGPEETKVTLTIMRFDDNKIRDITLNRAKITVPSVHGWQKDRRAKQNYMIDEHDRIGYVRISSFNSETTYDFETAINQLEKNGLKGLILDLRSNPGGLLKSAVEIADKFIEKGLLVRTQPRFGMSTYIAAKEDGTLENYPLVVLINNLTASSSEVLAGALCDEKYKRAVLVGQKSYGKGSVQSTTRRCGENTQLKYTIAYYYLPSGTRVQSREAMEKQGRTDWGITPDILVKLQDNELQKIADMQKANDSAVTIKQNNVFNRINNCSSQEVVSADPQLAIGLLALKSKMIRTGHELTIPD